MRKMTGSNFHDRLGDQLQQTAERLPEIHARNLGRLAIGVTAVEGVVMLSAMLVSIVVSGETETAAQIFAGGAAVMGGTGLVACMKLEEIKN